MPKLYEYDYEVKLRVKVRAKDADEAQEKIAEEVGAYESAELVDHYEVNPND